LATIHHNRELAICYKPLFILEPTYWGKMCPQIFQKSKNKKSYLSEQLDLQPESLSCNIVHIEHTL
jgi:hypothetical protein